MYQQYKQTNLTQALYKPYQQGYDQFIPTYKETPNHTFNKTHTTTLIHTWYSTNNSTQ